MTTSPTIPATPTGTDFADWLSPILVKELRQGLKTKAFVVTFIVVQVVMILAVGLQLLSMAGGADRSTLGAFDGFFWAFVWLPLLVMMPARGLTSVSEEVKANTLDLVQLTRLSAFRIVLGKWIALAAQTLLLVAAILPYAVLRYFFGEVDVIGDLKTIGLLLLSSLWLTAGAIALSSVHLAVRIIVLVVLFPTLITGIIPLMLMRAFGGSSSLGTLFEWSWFLPVIVVAYICLMLEIAASRIAPISENHAAPKRLLALGMGAVALALAALADEDILGAWVASSAFVWGWVVLEALTERTVSVPSLYASFARRGLPGRLAGRVLYPGWASGLGFTTLLVLMLFGVFAVVSHRHHASSRSDDWAVAMLVFPIALAAIASPVIVLLAFKKVKQPIWLYILVQALCGLLFLIASIVTELPNMRNEDVLRWLAPVPTSALFGLMNDSGSAVLRNFYGVVTLPVCGCILVYLGFRAFREFRLIRNLERASVARASGD